MAENPAVKRPLDASGDHLDGVKAVLLDIEGTTTPVSFVKVCLPVSRHFFWNIFDNSYNSNLAGEAHKLLQGKRENLPGNSF